MTKAEVEAATRALLDCNGLTDWKVIVSDSPVSSFSGDWCDGMCLLQTKEVIINMGNESDPYTNKEITDTIAHEVAHLLVEMNGHTETWLAKMIELGCSPSYAQTARNLYPELNSWAKIAKGSLSGSLSE
jgi:hypothetical protein